MPAILAAALVMLFTSVNACQAGILLPQQIGFDANDLEQSLGDSDSSTSSSTPQDSQQWPPNDNAQQPHPLGLLKAPLPTGNASSSSSSSSTGGAAGSGTAVCVMIATIAVKNDDISLGRLAEDRGLSLPDPPGTDLLRPPRLGN